MSTITLRLLGAPQLERHGAPVHIVRRKAVALLAYLAVTERTHTRDALGALLWPESSQKKARSYLRHAIYSINSALGHPRLVCEADRVAFPSQPDIWVDVGQFRSVVSSAGPYDQTDTHLSDATLEALIMAAHMYRADFMVGFAIPDSPEFDTWQLMQRESLQRELASVLRRLSCAYAEGERSQLVLAVVYAQRWLSLDPLHEPAHRTLMQLYAESGDRAAAYRQYEECVRVLDEEFSVEPEAETVHLNEEIRQGLPLVSGVRTIHANVKSTQSAAMDNLSAPATSFVGRIKEMAQIASKLADKDCRLLTIVGPGGSGKTRIAIESATAAAAKYRDGAHFVDLSPLESPELLATAIERSLDVAEMGVSSPRFRLCDFLRGKEMLLVLDNLEHVLEGVGLLSELLSAAPRLSILATSRERLNVREEWLLSLEGLSVPPGPPYGVTPVPDFETVELDDYDATKLFVSRMHQIAVSSAGVTSDDVSAENAASIVAICSLLEGMPLAIELAAGWTRTLTLAELQREIERSLNVLRSTLRDLPPRMRSMRAAFDHSWRLLTSTEKLVMAQVSVFRGGCSRDAVEKIASASVADLAGLVDKSWLRLLDNGRYAIHELARQYCEEKLYLFDDRSTMGMATDVRGRHCAYYGAYVGEIASQTNFKPSALDDILAEFGNLLAALYTSVELLDTQTAYDILMAIFFTGAMMGWLRFSIETMDTLASLLKKRLNDAHLSKIERSSVENVLLADYYGQLTLLEKLGLYDQSAIYYKCLRKLASTIQDERAQYYWTVNGDTEQINHAMCLGLWDEAYHMTLGSLESFEADRFDCYLYGKERGQMNWRSAIYFRLGQACTALGKYPEAEENFSRGIQMRTTFGEQRFRGLYAAHHALLALVVGDYERSESIARQGLHLSGGCGDRLSVAHGHLSIGRALAAQRYFERARKHLRLCLDSSRQTGRIGLVMQSLTELGRIELKQERPVEAIRCFEEAIDAFDRVDNDHINDLAGVWLGFGWAALDQGDCERAQEMFTKTQRQRGATAYELQEAITGLGRVCLMRGKYADAHEMLQSVVDHSATSCAMRDLANHLLTMIGVVNVDSESNDCTL